MAKRSHMPFWFVVYTKPTCNTNQTNERVKVLYNEVAAIAMFDLLSSSRQLESNSLSLETSLANDL